MAPLGSVGTPRQSAEPLSNGNSRGPWRSETPLGCLGLAFSGLELGGVCPRWLSEPLCRGPLCDMRWPAWPTPALCTLFGLSQQSTRMGFKLQMKWDTEQQPNYSKFKIFFLRFNKSKTTCLHFLIQINCCNFGSLLGVAALFGSPLIQQTGVRSSLTQPNTVTFNSKQGAAAITNGTRSSN